MRSEISWKRLFAEGTAIVVGILAAFAIDASWDSYRDGQQLRRDLLALRADFTAVEEEVRSVGEVNATILAATDSLLPLLANPGTREVPTRWLFRATYGATFDPPTGSVDALISSGRLSDLEDEDLQEALAGWPAAVQDFDEKGQLHQTFVYEDLIPYMRDVTPFAVIVDSRFGLADPPETVAVQVTPALHARIAHLRMLVLRSATSPTGAPRVEELLDRIDAGLARIR